MSENRYYDRELINRERDSIAKIITLEKESLDLKIEYLSEKNKEKNINNDTRKLLKSAAVNDYFTVLSQWSRRVEEDNAIRINPNFNDIMEPKDEGFLINALTSTEFLNEDILNDQYGTSIMHSYLNVLQAKYSYATKTSLKSRFHKIYFDLANRLDGELLKAAQSLCISKMMSWNEPWPEILKCYEDYISKHGNDKFIKEFQVQNAKKLNLTESSDNKDFLIASSKIKSIDLTNLIQQNKGKPVYIDYWASWCPPCIENMPASKKLEQKLKYQVVFIYISIDTDEKKLEKIRTKTQIKSRSQFYLLKL